MSPYPYVYCDTYRMLSLAQAPLRARLSSSTTTFTRACLCMFACMYVCLSVCLSVCLYVCLYVCIWLGVWVGVWVDGEMRQSIKVHRRKKLLSELLEAGAISQDRFDYEIGRIPKTVMVMSEDDPSLFLQVSSHVCAGLFGVFGAPLCTLFVY